jgi:tripartite-type tricarboxylate transporter receptor subunit TctC
MKNALRMVELARASACVVGGGCLVIVGAAATQVHAQAQGYPAKPIRWIVPFPPGGGTDFVSRTLAPKLAEALGQQVVIDNRPGSGGTIGLAIAAKAPADGYHVVTAQTANIAIAPALYRKLGYDALKDFTPITRAVSAPLILVSHPSFPARNVADLIKIARAKPGEITYGSPGNGTGGHLGSEMIKLMAKVDMVHVPYKGASPALTDLLGGQIALYLSSLPPAVPMVKSGRLKALGVTGIKRASSLPDVPTIAESGLPGYAVESWYGVFVPAGTPKDIVTRLNTDLVRILGSNEVRDRLAADGSEATPTKAEEFAAFVRDEHQKWGRVVREARLTVD